MLSEFIQGFFWTLGAISAFGLIGLIILILVNALRYKEKR